MPSVSPKLMNLNKKTGFSDQILTNVKLRQLLLYKCQSLPNFGHMNTTAVQSESCNKLLVRSWTKTMTSYPSLRNIFISKRPEVANFVDIIKIKIMFIKTISKTQYKVKRSRNNVLKSIFCLYFQDNKNYLFLTKKC